MESAQKQEEIWYFYILSDPRRDYLGRPLLSLATSFEDSYAKLSKVWKGVDSRPELWVEEPKLLAGPYNTRDEADAAILNLESAILISNSL